MPSTVNRADPTPRINHVALLVSHGWRCPCFWWVAEEFVCDRRGSTAQWRFICVFLLPSWLRRYLFLWPVHRPPAATTRPSHGGQSSTTARHTSGCQLCTASTSSTPLRSRSEVGRLSVGRLFISRSIGRLLLIRSRPTAACSFSKRK